MFIRIIIIFKNNYLIWQDPETPSPECVAIKNKSYLATEAPPTFPFPALWLVQGLASGPPIGCRPIRQ